MFDKEPVARWRKLERDTKAQLEGTAEAESSVDFSDPCPDCGSQLVCASGGGVRCTTPKCGYWFCF